MTEKPHSRIRSWIHVGFASLLTLAIVALGVTALRPTAVGHAAGAPGPLATSKARFDPPTIYKSTAHTNAVKAMRTADSISSIPYFSSSFTTGGTQYNYEMVGTDPTHAPAKTTVPTEIVPVNVTVGSTTLKGSDWVNITKWSPIWGNAFYATAIGQYTDAFRRAEFWNYVYNNNYHVFLGTPSVHATINLVVPPASGQVVTNGNGKTYAEVDINWWGPQIESALAASGISPTVFPIFLTKNVLLYDTSVSNCCILGYHSDASSTVGTTTNIYTYAWGSYLSSGIFSSPSIADVAALSHEVAEWLDDPFVDNQVPSWSVPSEPQYGCSDLLEVGDPLVGTGMSMQMAGLLYHVQDETFFSWFAHQSPSIGVNHQYTLLGQFDTYSPSC